MESNRLRRLSFLELESREVMNATVALVAGTLTVTADPTGGVIDIFKDGSDLVVRSSGSEVGRFQTSAVTALNVVGGPGNDVVRVANDITLPTQLNGSGGTNKLLGGGGATIIIGGTDTNLLVGGTATNNFTSNGNDSVYKALPGDPVVINALAKVLREAVIPPPPGALGLPQETLSATDVDALLKRAAAASPTSDAIIAIVDRNGRILGVRVEGGVAPEITGNNANLVFAVDGALSLARTGAFFANNGAPLTSRTIQYISQTTITQREVESNPNIADPNSTVRGPGFVAPVGIGGHFPPGIAFTPQVDLFGIENTNRDGTMHLDSGGNLVALPERFNTDPAYTAQKLFAPDSYGFVSGLLPTAQNRGIATLPGGIPIYKNGQVVGGIGVFFPGKTGYATEENSKLSATYDPTKPDRSLEAEFIAFAAAGGVRGFAPVGTLGGVDLPPGVQIPGAEQFDSLRIDLVGIQLDVFGPGGLDAGRTALLDEAKAINAGTGNPNDGTDLVVNPAGVGSATFLQAGLAVPDGWIVTPHDGVGITKAQVEQIINDGIAQADLTRAAIRLPASSRSKMVFAVSDLQGNVVGLYRMPDATVFSIDVAVAKSRNVSYYADPSQLQAIDQLPGVPAGTAFTNRTFRYLANPRYPTGIDGSESGWFSVLRDGGTDPLTGLNTGAPLPASAFQSVLGYDSFNPGTNFHSPFNRLNQNGIVFFPGSAPIYKGKALIGGFGVSGDGVDQDDVVTAAGAASYQVPSGTLRADDIVYRGVRLPYQKFNRNPEG
ncbi:MAG: heme-binding protein [Gemmataceae bacterium]